jgi:hypothetical protein
MIFLFRCIILYQISSTKGKNNKVKKKTSKKKLRKNRDDYHDERQL